MEDLRPDPHPAHLPGQRGGDPRRLHCRLGSGLNSLLLPVPRQGCMPRWAELFFKASPQWTELSFLKTLPLDWTVLPQDSPDGLNYSSSSLSQ